jgi:capsular polysaccharide transport system permease protein
LSETSAVRPGPGSDPAARHGEAAKRSAGEIQKAVLLALFLRELKARFGGQWLGAFWTFLEPMAHLVVIMLIFAYLRHRSMIGVEMPVFLLTGIIPFFMFRSVALRLMDAIDANRGLFGYRQVRPIDPLISRAFLEGGLYATIYVVMLAVMGWFGFRTAPASPLEVLAILSVLACLAFGLGLAFASLTDDLPRARTFVRIAFLPLYLLSGVIFPIHTVPPTILDWLLWNPVLHAIELSRGYFFPQYQVLPQVSLFYLSSVTLCVLAFALTVYRARRHRLLAS